MNPCNKIWVGETSTGKNLGTFTDPDQADRFIETLDPSLLERGGFYRDECAYPECECDEDTCC